MIKTILIDDDEVVRTIWELEARKAGASAKFLTFANPKEFKSFLSSSIYAPHDWKDAVIYVDSDFGFAYEKGEEFAKELFDLGLRELYLCTGYPPAQFSSCFWLKGIVGKFSPWSAHYESY